MQLGCRATEKMFKFNIMHACKKLLEVFDNRQDENIILSPMIMCMDPVYGFPHSIVRSNLYSQMSESRHSNWVHPNEIGYKQCGDCLAAVIEHFR